MSGPASFGSTRVRLVEGQFTLTNDTNAREVTWDRPTLVVAVKSDCDGCRVFYDAEQEMLIDHDVVLVARSNDDVPPASRIEVFVSPALLDAVGVRSYAAYAYVVPDPPRVVAEGVVFSLDQVFAEVSRIAM